MAAPALAAVAAWFPRTHRPWDVAAVGGAVVWSIGVVLTLLSMALLWSAHRRIVAER